MTGFRLSALLLLAALPGLSAQAQQGAVDLVFRGVPARAALGALAERTGISLVYPSRLVGETRVWCGGAGWTPERLLGCIADAAGLDYVRRSSGTYVLTLRVEERPQRGSVTGRVVDAETGEPLPSANVLLADARTGTATDAGGAFVVAGLLAGPHTVVASHAGYEPARATVQVTPGRAAAQQLALRRRALATAPVVIDGLTARPRSEELGVGAWAPAAIREAGTAATADVAAVAAQTLGVAPRSFRDGLSVQGGENGEHPVLLDGATVYEPLALGQIVGAFSPLAVGRVTVQKAGFGARHGSFVAGVLQAEHDLAAPPDAHPLAVEALVDPLAVNARAAGRATLGTRGRRPVEAVAMVAARRSLWDALRPGELDAAIRRWNRVDPLLASALAGAPEGAERYDTHRHGSDVRFSDLHAAARVSLSPLRTVRASFYTGESQIGTELFAAAVLPTPTPAPEGLLLTRDRYRWTNRALTARYSALLGARALASAGLRASRHTLSHAAASLDGVRAGLDGSESTAEAELALRAALDARPTGDDGNRLGELTLDAQADVSLGPGHTARLGLEATRLDSRFHLGAAGASALAFRSLDQTGASYRLAAVAEDQLALGQRVTVEPGLRLTALSAGGRVYAEPRLAVRYDALAADRLAGLSARLGGGVYRQFVVREDLATVGPSALVPSVAVWLPVDGSVAPPLALHVSGEVLVEPAPGWSVRAEAYGRAQPHVLEVNYAALLAPGDPLTRQADFLLGGEGRSVGAGARVERQSRRVSVSAAYAWDDTARRFADRFGGRWVAAPWSQPHRVTLASDVALAGAARPGRLLARGRARGTWGRTWAFRRAYYEVLGATGSSPAPFALDAPDADRLPALVEVDLGLAYGRPLGRSRVEVALDVLNVLDRANTLDWSLQRAPDGGMQAVTRTLPGRQVALRLRVAY